MKKVNPYADKEKLPFVIAEIGINHNGDVLIAKKLIDTAQECGANAVKFQKRTLDIVYTQAVLDTPRQSPWGGLLRDSRRRGLSSARKSMMPLTRIAKKRASIGFPQLGTLKARNF